MLKFDVPLYLTTGVRKPKNNWLNINNYRNWHCQVSNNLKKLFCETIDVSHLPKVDGQMSISYVFFYPDKSRRDIDNSLGCIAKFTADALIHYGVIEDDNHNIVTSITGSFGGYDPDNPRCEVTIIPQESA